MNQSDDQNNSNLRVSGYGSRIKQTLIIVVALAVIVTAIVLAALWANSREPESGIQPTPRPTQAPQSTATMPPPDTPTTAPTESVEVKVADTTTPEPTESPPEDTPTPVDGTPEQPEADTPTLTSTVSALESSAEETPKAETVPTPEPTEQPTVAPTDTLTPISPTETPDDEPTVAATNTPKPEPTATPTITPTPMPTATPTITPTPTPEVPTKLEIYARGDLIDQGINQSDLKIVSVLEHTWPDLTLGCGSINDDNPARPVDGWILIIGNDEKTYTFHVASKDQGDAENLDEDIVINCTDVGYTEQLTFNLVHDLRLHEARRVILYRGSKDDEQQPIQDIQDGELIQAIVDALNTSIPIGNTEICETAYRLDFYILRGIQTIRFFCENDWFRVEGEQDLWRGTQGALPQELLNSVAPFFASATLPPIPTFAPGE